MPKRTFDHILVTRFNVRLEGKGAATDEWLKARINLLRDWGMPSVRKQILPFDRWLLFCDASSPNWFKTELSGMLHSGEEIIWVDGIFGPKAAAVAVTKRTTGKEFLITTRMDNDDAISSDFVSLIHEQFNSQSLEFINFTVGAQHCDGRFYLRLDPSNAFVSLIERRTEHLPLTVFVDWHNRLAAHGPVRRVKSHIAWLQNVHGGNIGNVIRGIPILPDRVLRYFALDIPVRQESAVGLQVSAFLAMMKIAFRVIWSPHRVSWLIKSLLSINAPHKSVRSDR